MKTIPKQSEKSVPSASTSPPKKPAPSKQIQSQSDEGLVHQVILNAPDGGWGWVVVLCAFLSNVIIDGLQYSFGVYLEPLQAEFGVSVMEVSLIGSLFSGFYNFSGPFGGALVNKFGFRMVAVTGSITGCAAYTLSFLSPAATFLYFTHGLIGGVGLGMIYMSSVVTTSFYFDRLRALATSITVCGTGIGTFLFAPLTEWSVGEYGWRYTFLYAAGLISLCIIFGLFYRPLELITLEEVIDSSSASTSTITMRGPRGRGLDQGSIFYSERGASLHNTALSTLKEALEQHQEVEGRRNTTAMTASFIVRTGRASTIISGGQSLIFRPRFSTSEEIEVINKRKGCRATCKSCCFNCWHCRCKRKELTLGDRPMYRDDIFYEGSLAMLPNYTPDDPLKYHLSVTRLPAEKDAEQHASEKCCVCHEAMLRTFVTMTGLNLFKIPTFVFLCTASFFFTLGVYIPYVYVKNLAVTSNVSKNDSVWLISAIGIANTTGRILSGIIKSCFVNLKSSPLLIICLFLAGSSNFIVFYDTTWEYLMAFCSLYGLLSAPFVSLRPVLIVEFLGLDKLTNAFGLVLLAQGVASIFGAPLAGLVQSKLKNDKAPFALAGAFLIASALFMILAAYYHGKVKKLTFGTYLQDIAESFGVEKSKVALIGSIMFGVHLTFGPICAGLSNSFGIRPISMSGAVLSAIGLVLTYFTKHYQFLYLTYGILGGIGLGCIFMNTIVITSLYFSKLRPLAISIVICGTGVGTVSFALAGNLMIKHIDWRTIMLLEALIALSMFLAAWSFRPLKPKQIITTEEANENEITTSSKVIPDTFNELSEPKMYLRRATTAVENKRRASAWTVQGSIMELVAGDAIAPEPKPETRSGKLSKTCGNMLCCKKQEEVIVVHPTLKRDIFVQTQPTDRASFVSSVYDRKSVGTSLDQSRQPSYVYASFGREKKEQKKIRCEQLRKTVTYMLDFKIMKSPAFVVLIISNSLTISALITVFTYERDRNIQRGFTDDMATYFVVCLGGLNMIWRLLLGTLSTFSGLNPTYLCVFGLVVGGIATAVSGLNDSQAYSFCYCILSAFGMASFAVFRPVILVNLVGTELVVNATGISLMFMGLSSIIGPPLAGFMMEYFEDYNAIFYLAGALFVVSGLLLLTILRIKTIS